MQISQHFPTLIGYKNDTDFTNKLIPISKNILNTKSSNQTLDYDSTYTSPEAIEEINSHSFIPDYIKNLSLEYVSNIGYKIVDDIKIQCFFSKMKQGNSHNTHLHPNTILSGVCYLDCEPNSSPILFEDPRTSRFYNSLIPTGEPTQNNSMEISHIPQNGDILIWESWLRHRVMKNTTSNRTTLVFNIVRESIYNLSKS